MLETLFSVWSFEAPQDLTLAKANITAALAAVPWQQQPDFIVVSGRFLWRGGHYLDLSTNGQLDSHDYKMRLQQVDGDPAKLVISAGQMWNLGANTLVTFLYWLNSWLYAAGPRRPDLVAYYPMTDWGTVEIMPRRAREIVRTPQLKSGCCCHGTAAKAAVILALANVRSWGASNDQTLNNAFQQFLAAMRIGVVLRKRLEPNRLLYRICGDCRGKPRSLLL